MIVKVYENLHFPGEAFQMANALFALIPEARLRGVMGALHRFSDLPLRLLDAEGNILCALGELAGCCALLQRELNTWQECNALHAKAGARARELGGSYIYTCTAGLSHISFPLGNREALLGALVVGPFLMEKPEDIQRKFKRAITDSDTERCVRFDPENKPGVSNLMQIYSVATGASFDGIEREFDGRGYGDFKKAVGESVVELLRPIREETERLLADKAYLESVYRAGAEKAAYVANRTLSKVYKKVGFLAR